MKNLQKSLTACLTGCSAIGIKTAALLLLLGLGFTAHGAATSVIGTVTVTAATDCGGSNYEVFALTNTQGSTATTAGTFKFVTTGTYTAADVTVFPCTAIPVTALPGLPL